MIKSFKCRETERLAKDLSSKRFRNIERIARRKLEMLEAATRLEDLRSPPGNRLESLRGNRIGQYSIRINNQFRICFRWADNAAWDVEIIDYH
jgi:proteic killer suppression protein